MENCVDCSKEYDPQVIEIPNPIPDGMCAVCGSILTEEEQEEVRIRLGNPTIVPDDKNIIPLIDINAEQ